MIPGLSGAGPISAFAGSGGFDGGTATSGSKQQAAIGTGDKTYNFAAPQRAATVAVGQMPVMLALVALGAALWFASRR